MLVASRRFDGSRSRKTKGSLADTLQCNIWRRAQTPHRMTHSLHGGANHGENNGFAALSTAIGTPNSSDKDCAYVIEHPVLKYLQPKLDNFLNDFRRPDWFTRFGLPVSNGRHNQLSESQVRRLMRRVEQRAGTQGGGSGRDRPEIQVFSRLDLGTRTSTARSLSTAGRSGPITSWCECARFAIGMQAKYAVCLHLDCMLCAISMHFVRKLSIHLSF